MPLFLLAGCSEEDIGEAIEDAILNVLGAIGKIILISLALILAWAAGVAIGGVLVALGVRRKRVDGPALALFVLGGGIIVAMWPLVFSEAGLAGVMAPGSTATVRAGPVVGQIVAVIAAIVVAVVATKRYRRRAAAKRAAAQAPILPPPPPPPPEVAAPAPPTHTPAAKRSPSKATTKRPARPKAGAKSR